MIDRFFRINLTICALFLAFSGHALSRELDLPASSWFDPEAPIQSYLVNPVPRLSEVVGKGLLGVKVLLPEEELQRLEKDGLKLLLLKKKKLRIRDRVGLVKDCVVDLGQRIFCRSLNEFQEDEDLVESPEAADRPAEKRITPAAVSQGFEEANLSTFDDVKKPAILKGLKSYDSFEPLIPLTKASLSSSVCPNADLLSALGLKAEEFFPEKKYLDIAVALFRRTIECAGSTEATERARFRLGLIHVWKSEWTQAFNVLEPLAADPKSDYRTRAIFWRAYAARKTDRDSLSEESKRVLVSEHQLSYHSVLAAGEKVLAKFRERRDLDPTVRFRSDKLVDLNAAIEAAEVMAHLKEWRYAKEFLVGNWDELLRAEPELRLYVATLFQRAGDPIRTFRVMSSVFQDDPGLISKTTLQLFYPLPIPELLEKQKKRIDPLLVASLIRQESGFNSHARSRVGARGLMQIMPQTAWSFGRVSRGRLFDPQTNVDLGTRYFVHLIEKYNGDVQLALAAYNAGYQNVDRWRQRYPTSNRMLFFDLIPFKETRDYVALISRNYYWYVHLYSPETGDREPASQSNHPYFQEMYVSY